MLVSQLIKQKPYEEIEFLLRRHPLTFVSTAAIFILLAIIPVVFYFLTSNLFPDLLKNTNLYALLVLFGSIYYLSIYLFFYSQFVDFYLDLWVVTNDRIIDMDQSGLFSRTISECDLYRIQDVTVEVKGMFATFFHYGNVFIKTASANTHIVFYYVPNPNQVREALIQLAEQDRKFHHEQ